MAEGVPDFKLFTAYQCVFYSDDGAIFRAMQQTAKNGGLIMMHAENGLIDVAAQTVEAARPTHTATASPKAVFEGEATNRVIRLAEAAACRVYIVHLSAKDALTEVRAARDRGLMAFAETCPQYLFLSLDDLGNGSRGEVRLLAAPPPGSLGRSVAASSRTTCRSFRPTTARSTSRARRSSAGATSGRSRTARPASRTGSTCCTTAAWSAADHPRAMGRGDSTAPAKLFGMYPRKGFVSVGADADLVIYDPNRRRTISAKTHYMDVDYRATRAARSVARATSSCRAVR